MTAQGSPEYALPTSGELVLFDTEYTAWEGSQERRWSADWEHRELVEVGAVRVDATDFHVLDQFQRFTVPKVNPRLSDYFKDLTGIRQEDIDKEGVPLSVLFHDFAKFGQGCGLFVSNGNDSAVFEISAGIQGVDVPIAKERFANIRPALERVLSAAPGELTTGLLPARLGLPMTGALHSAIDDAVALARTLAELRRTGRF
ncbi:exonuclease domain-containing protein [Hwanghaeella grinnelliae]|uniref:Exonuclease domain-containing protein n=1 Tax=Hwanghaeella grinnelliae TaxID=2500179 RepID=A0A3S2Z7E0_9PROT|nr:3'-5' exonuclease [Hwanghaeella grinnelliae]RVU36374.1 exonuclease domain-containing protein [Hwanghaeella grinnelliae]